MNELQVINQQEVLGKHFRVYGTIENPLFLAKDVAEWIEHSRASEMLKGINEDEKLMQTILASGQRREMWFLTEDGFYEVLMQSRKPIAKQFKKEVKKILKDIRKTGMYATDELLDNPDLLIAAATKLKEERAARIEAEKKVKILKPKADFYDDVAGSKDSIEMGHVAKVLGIKNIGRNKLFEILRNKKILDRNNIPYQKFVDSGYFRVLEQKYTTPSGETKINIKTMVFQKGVDYIRKVVKEDKNEN